MIKKAMIIWVSVLATAVPYAAYYLLFEATRDQYAGLIVFILFWIFGYWSLAGPLITACKFYKLKKAVENISSRDEFIRLIQNPETEDAAVDFIVRENGVPQFMARWAYQNIIKRLAATQAQPLKQAKT